MTICKYCLVDKYNIVFNRVSPDKGDIVKAIFSVYPSKSYFKGKSWDDILKIFYKEKAFSYDNLSEKRKKKIRKLVLLGTKMSS